MCGAGQQQAHHQGVAGDTRPADRHRDRRPARRGGRRTHRPTYAAAEGTCGVAVASLDGGDVPAEFTAATL